MGGRDRGPEERPLSRANAFNTTAGKERLQVEVVHSRHEAETLAACKDAARGREHDTEIGDSVVGDIGTLFRARIGEGSSAGDSPVEGLDAKKVSDCSGLTELAVAFRHRIFLFDETAALATTKRAWCSAPNCVLSRGNTRRQARRGR
jgi:hypothetical protein